CTFGDLMFGLSIPIPLHTASQLKTLAALLMPLAGRLPFEWVYPTGEKQEIRVPKYQKYYQWATVVAGDCHYIKRHMPDDMKGKVVVTNTTTPEDVALFKQCGIKYLVTTTPVLDGRSFGTNVMEAALIAVSGKGRQLTQGEYNELLTKLKFEPQLQVLN
ncbi:MAG: quinate 5-dehydrogenase, partial [Anaerolineales bacterium]